MLDTDSAKLLYVSHLAYKNMNSCSRYFGHKRNRYVHLKYVLRASMIVQQLVHPLDLYFGTMICVIWSISISISRVSLPCPWVVCGIDACTLSVLTYPTRIVGFENGTLSSWKFRLVASLLLVLLFSWAKLILLLSAAAKAMNSSHTTLVLSRASALLSYKPGREHNIIDFLSISISPPVLCYVCKLA